MSYSVNDGRPQSRGRSKYSKHLRNQQRLRKRVDDAAREAAEDQLREGSIKDIGRKSRQRIEVRSKRTKEYTIHHDKGGVIDRVFPGNKDFTQGDQLDRPPAGGAGSKGSPDGDGLDDFIFDLSQKEFLDYIFEDCDLWDMIKKTSNKDETERYNAGIVNDGTQNNMDLVRSLRKAISRRITLRSAKKTKIKALEEELHTIFRTVNKLSDNDLSIKLQRCCDIYTAIAKLVRGIKKVPFLDTFDFKYHHYERRPVPTTKAVMFCLMDVSGSMTRKQKDIAKRFYILLYLFLTVKLNYKRVEIVWIRYHTQARVVDEEEFFYSRETGGTIASTALEVMKQVIDKEFPVNEWNIYGSLTSDGDDWPEDIDTFCSMMVRDILPLVQHFSYLETRSDRRRSSDLWEPLSYIEDDHDEFQMDVVWDKDDVYEAFRSLYGKKGVAHGS